jgi:hypothetical protein
MRFRRCHSRRIIILAIRSGSQGRATEEKQSRGLAHNGTGTGERSALRSTPNCQVIE